MLFNNPNLWKYEKIAKVCSNVETVNPAQNGSGSFLYIDISSIDNQAKVVSKALRVTNEEAPSRARQLIAKNDILVSTVRPNLNAVALISAEYDGQICSTGFCVLRPKKDLIDPQFLFAWVRSAQFIQSLTQLERGIGYPAVSDSDVRVQNIPLPPLPEQHRIVAVLRQADELRRLRRRANERAQQLLPALFYEMFGDPIVNPKHWPVKPIKEFGRVTTGNTPPRNDPSNYGDYIEWLKSDNLNTFLDYATESKEYLSEQGSKRGRVALEGSTLITCIAGSHDSIGKAALLDRDAAFNQQINAVVPFSDVNPFYLYGVIKLSKSAIQELSTKGMKGIVNKSQLETVELIYPPKSRQNTFAEQLSQLINLKQINYKAQAQIETLFQSLLSQAFTGELTAQWRESHQEELAEVARQRDKLLTEARKGVRVSDLVVPELTAEEASKRFKELLPRLMESVQVQMPVSKAAEILSELGRSILEQSNTSFKDIADKLTSFTTIQIPPGITAGFAELARFKSPVTDLLGFEGVAERIVEFIAPKSNSSDFLRANENISNLFRATSTIDSMRQVNENILKAIAPSANLLSTMQALIEAVTSRRQYKNHSRYELIQELGWEQYELFKQVSKMQGYFTAESLNESSEIPLEMAQRGLPVLAEAGLVRRVSMARQAEVNRQDSGPVVYVEVYRAIQAEPDETRLSDLARLETGESTTLNGGESA